MNMDWGITAAAAVCGVLAGMGVGGGTLFVVALTLLFGIEQLEAQSLNLIFFLAVAPMALIGHIKNKLIEWKAVLFALPMGLITAGISSHFAQDFDPLWLKRIFGILLLLVGIKELLSKPPQEKREE